MSEQEEELLKVAVDFIAKQMQNPLNNFIRSIQNSKSGKENDLKKEKGVEQKKKAKDNDALTSTRVFF